MEIKEIKINNYIIYLILNQNILVHIYFNCENQKIDLNYNNINSKYFQYYNKDEIICIKNTNNPKGNFNIICDYTDNKCIIRNFEVNIKYKGYIELLNNLKPTISNLIKESILSNLAEDLFNDIKNNLFRSLIQICNNNKDITILDFKNNNDKKLYDLKNTILSEDYSLIIIIDKFSKKINENINFIFSNFNNL